MKGFSSTKSIPLYNSPPASSLSPSLIEYLFCKLRVRNNPPVPIDLQGVRTDIQLIIHFLTR